MIQNGLIARSTRFVFGILVASLAAGRPLAAQELGEGALRQIQAIYADKATWTSAERKLATPLLMAHRQSRGEAMVQGLEPFPRIAARAGVDSAGMVVVDIKSAVTDDLVRTIRDVGGQLIAPYASYDAVRARLPIRRLDAVAALPEVRQMSPEEPFLANTGSATTEGDVAHAADTARTMYSIDGTGVRIGVLSDGVSSLAARQATNDLPPTCADPPAPGPCVAVVPGQGGSRDEGTAMLEILHDLAPGAQLFFATAANGSASFATNIQTLRNTYGCDVIVDDISYIAEGAFQDGTIAQAVNAVTASGALYFSSAGNSGRLSAGTSGTWEGDFVDSLTAIPPPVLSSLGYPPRPVHSFNGLTGGSAAPSDPLTATSPYYISLKWSDPLGGSANDYDLFLLNSGLTTLLDYSIFAQAGTQDPFEFMYGGFPGEKIMVVKYSGAARALRLDTHRGGLSIATDGAVYGHNAAEETVSVAAVDVGTAGGGVFAGGVANPAETYSSDGPRHMFFKPNGTAITPGNLLFGTGGGQELQKPDLAAADCVTTTTPGFFTFCGTSAAAPHAAAIAALLLSTDNHPSGGQALAAVFETALDVDPAGRDKDSGMGIVMADAAATALMTTPATDFYTLDPCRVFDTREAGGPTSGTPLTCGLDYDFALTGSACGVPVGATAVSVNVTVTGATAQGNLRLFPSETQAPVVSTLNYVAGVNRANNAVAPLSAGGQIAVRCEPAGSTHVIVDVNGYFE